MTITIKRGAGHPWTAHPGWDQMLLYAGTLEKLSELVAKAEEKFWRVWFGPGICGDGHLTHLYKPSDATKPWGDIPWQGTPRGHGHAFKVGDEVYTDFSRKITRHRITEIGFVKACHTGVMLRVTPWGLSTFVGDDGRERKTSAPWIDAAWFRKVPEHIG